MRCPACDTILKTNKIFYCITFDDAVSTPIEHCYKRFDKAVYNAERIFERRKSINISSNIKVLQFNLKNPSKSKIVWRQKWNKS